MMSEDAEEECKRQVLETSDLDLINVRDTAEEMQGGEGRHLFQTEAPGSRVESGFEGTQTKSGKLTNQAITVSS